MVKKVQEQHIAVFGEGGSGKTVLLSAFFGAAEDSANANDLWDLVAGDAGQGHRLLANYLGMKRDAALPPGTQFAATTYRFSLRLKGAQKKAKQPFDELCLVWHDYPGEWFEGEPSSEEEKGRRATTFEALVRSDVALLLVDGQKLLDYTGEEERYLRSLLGNFRQEVLRQKDLLDSDDRLIEFPRIWIMALSKADLFPEWDVNDFRELMIVKAADQIDQLRKTLIGMVDTPAAMSVAEDFALLSSAKFKLSAAGPVEIDVTKRKGLDLILPVACLLPLQRRVEWAEKFDVPVRVLDKLADGAEALAAVLVSGHMEAVEKLIAKLPKVGPFVAMAAGPLLNKAVEIAGEKLKEVHDQALANKDYLTATLTQFKIDLEQGVADGLLFRSKQ
ncbi:hypothetical protein ACFWQC_03010 [Nocardioides sp. NPDC058538]|uniref:TRAFAC clade GTPase domain-containing protein n=1 Tax=Nocardioides sp. NPDC058538 TaxID=3346542 RepID=UPI00365C6DA4